MQRSVLVAMMLLTAVGSVGPDAVGASSCCAEEVTSCCMAEASCCPDDVSDRTATFSEACDCGTPSPDLTGASGSTPLDLSDESVASDGPGLASEAWPGEVPPASASPEPATPPPRA